LEARRKRRALLAVSILVTGAAVLYFVLKVGDQWCKVGEAIRKGDYRYVIPSVATLSFFYIFRIIRLRVFLRPIKEVSWPAVSAATCIGFMANCVLPLRAGELIRPYVVHRKGGVKFGEAAGVAGLERVFDLIGPCVLLLATWLALAGRAGSAAAGGATDLETLWRRGLFMVALAGVGVVGLLVLALAPSLTLRIAALLLRAVPAGWRGPLMGFLESIVGAMEFLKSPVQVCLCVLLTLGQWAGITLSTYVLSLGFDLDLTLGSVLLIQLATTVMVAAPQAPAFIGMFHTGVMMGAAVFGIDKGTAAALAIVLWAVNVIPITIVGLALLHREGLSLRGLARASREAAEGGREPS